MALIILAIGFSVADVRLSWALASLADTSRGVLRLFLERAYRSEPDLDPEVHESIPDHILAWIDRESEDWAKDDLRSQVRGLFREHGDWEIVFRIATTGHAGWGEEVMEEDEV